MGFAQNGPGAAARPRTQFPIFDCSRHLADDDDDDDDDDGGGDGDGDGDGDGGDDD